MHIMEVYNLASEAHPIVNSESNAGRAKNTRGKNDVAVGYN